MTDRSLRSSGGFGGYVGGWRVSLRLAARDMRKHRGRSVLVVLLIGLPLLVVSGVATLAFTQDVSPREGIARTMGSGQALVTPDANHSIAQDAAGTYSSSISGLPSSLDLGGDPKGRTAAEIKAVTGGSLHPITSFQTYVSVGDRSIFAAVLGLDRRQKVYDGMAHLTSGRWPKANNEVLVSRAGADRGIPTRGVISVHSKTGSTRTLRVVGRVDTPSAEDLVTLPHGQPSSWILQRDSAVRWSEVRHLNRYGLLVASREVINHPAQAEADPVEREIAGTHSADVALLVLLGTGLVIVIALLAGPAFASSAARHRRALGQLASNGASKSQLRRYVLAQALLLGALSALIGMVLGALLGGTATRVYAQWAPTEPAPGPLDFRWGWGLLLLAVAVFASLVAAFLPAVSASRVNLIAVLRGHVSVTRVHFGWPVLGLLVAVAGGAALTVALAASEGRNGEAADTSAPVVGGIVVGAVALFAGTLMTAPWLLARLGNLAGRLPLPLRVAARDIGRQRGRAVATTGAILATVAALTTLSITVASNTRAQQMAYQPSLPEGHAAIFDGSGAALEANLVPAVKQQLPEATLTRLRGVGGPDPTMQREGRRIPVLTGYQHGCTSRSALQYGGDESSSGSGCSPLFGGSMGDQLITATPRQLAATFRLSERDTAALRDGRMLFPRGGGQADPGRPVRVVSGTGRASMNGLYEVHQTGETTVATAVSRQKIFTMAPQKKRTGGVFYEAASAVMPAALMSSRAVAKLPGDTYLATLLIHDPGGISSSAERNVDGLLDGDTQLYVERGPAGDTTWIWLLIGGVFGLLVLVATLASTALSNAESRADSATFASLGAPPKLRRLIAGSNAAMVGLFGSLLGLLVGGVAGYAASHPATQTALGAQHRTLIVIPWGTLLTVTIGVPLLAGVLAALATRGRVPMVRRLG